MDESQNVFGEALELCSEDPVTGFFRDGCCNTSGQDAGSHTVCVQVTAEFPRVLEGEGKRPLFSGAGVRISGPASR